MVKLSRKTLIKGKLGQKLRSKNLLTGYSPTLKLI